MGGGQHRTLDNARLSRRSR